MEDWAFTDDDRMQAQSLGISEALLRRQIALFQKSSHQVRLQRPCTLGDGIHALPPGAMDRYISLQQQAAGQGRFLKFVPASGAATRMFQTLSQCYYQHAALSWAAIRQQAAQGDDAAAGLVQCMDNLARFAFFDDLRDAMARAAIDLEQARAQGRWHQVLGYLLTARGLNCAALPKGLLKFHRDDDGGRTAFEEHLVEAAHYVRDREGVCRLHFTVSPEHREGFRRLLEKVRSSYERRYQVQFQIGFSVQKRSTDTLAVDLDNRPLRDQAGHLQFRPGGHGALLENLNDLQGDLIFIKNIDNVVPDRLKEPSITWKKVLGGYLVAIQQRVHGYLRKLLEGSPQDGLLAEISAFVQDRLFIALPQEFGRWSLDRRVDGLVAMLHRPLRVCGMVRNVGEPGGGPFWVTGSDGAASLQIVESAQVDAHLAEQQRIWQSATHFNPVDIACAVRDHEGKAFDLRDFVDPDAVFIARKAKDGRALKALELPGLWNGAMARWITLFVEVPGATFNPVKTVNVLLKPEHLAD